MKKFLHLMINNTVLPIIIGALVSFITTTYLEDKNRGIILKPYLVADVKTNETRDRFGIVVMNMGKGPAIIENDYISVNDIKYTFNNENPRTLIVSFLQDLDLYSSCKEYLLVDFFPVNGFPINDGKMLDFLTIPEPDKLPIAKLRDDLLATSTGKRSVNDIENNLDRYVEGYNNCRDKFIDTLENPKNKIKMRLHYKSINGELYEDEWQSIRTYKPLDNKS